MSDKAYYNEKLVLSSTGEYLTLDITGNKTESKEDIFKRDLAPDERILKEFEVELAPAAFRNIFVFYFLCFITLGMYYVYIYYCSCCRPKSIWTKRGRLVVTSKNRIGVWTTDTSGVQAKGKRGNRTLGSVTKITWFSIGDIAHLQHVHYDSVSTSFFCCTVKSWESSLKIFFGSYPDQAMYEAMNLKFAVPKSVEMAGGLYPDTVAMYFSVLNYFALGFSSMAKKLAFATGFASIPDSVMLEITSCWLDTKHNAKDGYDGLLDLQRTLFSMQNTKPSLKKKGDSKRFRIGKAASLIEDGIVNLDPEAIALVKGEQFIDAYSYITHWTLMEIFYTVCTLGLYWVFVLRFRHGLKSAMVISTHRVWEFCQRNSPSACTTGSENTWIVRSWILSGMSAGVVVRERSRAWTEIQTRFGSLRLLPYSTVGLIDEILYGMSRETFDELKPFLLFFAQTETSKVLNYRSQLPVPSMVNEHFVMLEGEEFCGHHQGNGIKYNPVRYGTIEFPDWLTIILSFGRFPFHIVQDLVVTTHRVLAVSSANNNPWLMVTCLDVKYQVIFWSDVSSKDFLGLQVRGDVNILETDWTRYCACLGCTGVQAHSYLSLSYAFGPDRKGFAISIPTFARNATTGLLEDSNLDEIRSVLGMIHAAKSDTGLLAASASSPTEKSLPPYPEVQGYPQMPEHNYDKKAAI